MYKPGTVFPQIPEFTITKPSQYLKTSPAFIFHHLIKCGGTSVVHALRNWFSIEFDYLKDPADIDNFVKCRRNIDNISCDTCIVGHFEYEKIYIDVRYPEILTRGNEIKTFMFIRDPLKFVISFYFYSANQGRMQNVKLAEYINSNKNLLAYFLNCDETNFKDVLDRYFFIGIVESMQESLNKLADTLRKRRISIPIMNESVKDDQINLINQNFIDNFRAENELDYMIYDYCLEKFYKL